MKQRMSDCLLVNINKFFITISRKKYRIAMKKEQLQLFNTYYLAIKCLVRQLTKFRWLIFGT